jgi:hypothetical protein
MHVAQHCPGAFPRWFPGPHSGTAHAPLHTIGLQTGQHAAGSTVLVKPGSQASAGHGPHAIMPPAPPWPRCPGRRCPRFRCPRCPRFRCPCCQRSRCPCCRRFRCPRCQRSRCPCRPRFRYRWSRPCPRRCRRLPFPCLPCRLSRPRRRRALGEPSYARRNLPREASRVRERESRPSTWRPSTWREAAMSCSATSQLLIPRPARPRIGDQGEGSNGYWRTVEQSSARGIRWNVDVSGSAARRARWPEDVAPSAVRTNHITGPV